VANDFSQDASCKALWKFESGALTVDSKSTNTLQSANNPAANTSDFREGAGCVALTGDPTQQGLGPCFKIDNVDLVAGFPLKTGDTAKTMTICSWIKPLDVAQSDPLLGFINTDDINMCSLGVGYGGSFYNLRVKFNDQIRNTFIQLFDNEWHHITLAVDGINKLMYVRVYRVATGITYAWWSTFTAELVIGSNFGVGTRADIRSGYGYKYMTFKGSFDEVVVFNRFLNVSEMDQVRSGTFGSGASVVAETGTLSLTLNPLYVDDTGPIDIYTEVPAGSLPWKKVAGNPQAGDLNCLGMVRHENRWYMISCEFVPVLPTGSNFEYVLSEVLDIQTMRRVRRGGPWYGTRYPTSSMWMDGNSTNGCRLIVYKDKIYFVMKDESATTPRVYYTRVFRFDPRAGIGPVTNVYTVSNPTVEGYVDAWPNDMVIHNDKLYIACCEKIIVFNGTSWSTQEPLGVSFLGRLIHYAYTDYVSLCSHGGKLYASVKMHGEPPPGYTYGPQTYEGYRIIATADGHSWTIVSQWPNDTYSSYDDIFTSLTSFNGNIYMALDVETSERSAIYKLVEGKGDPQLVRRDASWKYRVYGTLFTTPYDCLTKMYIGSYNSIKVMDVNETITNDIAIKPRRPTQFSITFPIDPDTGRLVYVGGAIGWISSVNNIIPSNVYYTETYYKDFTPAYTVKTTLPRKTIVQLDKDPKSNPNPDNPDLYVLVDPPHALLILHEVTVITTIVVGIDVQIVLGPAPISLIWSNLDCDVITSSILNVDLLNLSTVVFNAHATITDNVSHSADLLSLTASCIPIKGVQHGIQLGGPHCKALWNFEPGALTIDSKGSNDFTDYYYVTESTGGYKQGAGAADFELSSLNKFQIEDEDLDDGFPLKSGDTTKTMSACFWIKPETVAGSQSMRVLAKYNYTAEQISFGIAINSSKIRVHWSNDGTSTATFATTNPTLVVGQWYHVAVVMDGINKSIYIRIWDDTAQTVYESSFTPTTEMYVGSSALTVSGIAAYENAVYGYDGILDELAVFDNLLTPSNIDLIRTSGIPAYGHLEEFGPDALAITDCISISVTPKSAVARIPVQVPVSVVSGAFTFHIPNIKLPHSAPIHHLRAIQHTDIGISTKYVYNMFSDPSLKARFKFNSGALTTDSVSTNVLTSHGTPDTIASGMPEGNACVQLVPGTTEYYSRTNTNLSPGFPLKSTETAKIGTWTFWFKSRITPGAAMRLGGKYYSASGGRSLGISHEASGRLMIFWGGPGGTSSEQMDTGFTIVPGEWYHFALTFNGVAKSAYAVLYRVSTGTTLTFPMTFTNALYLSSSADFNIGAFQGAGCYDGQIDDWCVWNKRLSDTEIYLVKELAGSRTYVYDTAETSNILVGLLEPTINFDMIVEVGKLSLVRTLYDVEVSTTHPFNDAIDNWDLVLTLSGSTLPTIEESVACDTRSVVGEATLGRSIWVFIGGEWVIQIFTLGERTPTVPGSVVIHIGSRTITDNGIGQLVESGDPGTHGSCYYDEGSVTLYITSGPPPDQPTWDYDYVPSSVKLSQEGAYLNSKMTTSVTGPGDLSFWWAVDSAGGMTDTFTFSVDDWPVDTIYGTNDPLVWAQKTIHIDEGVHPIEWSFFNGDAGGDSHAGWVDKVSYVLNNVISDAELQSTNITPLEVGVIISTHNVVERVAITESIHEVTVNTKWNTYNIVSVFHLTLAIRRIAFGGVGGVSITGRGLGLSTGIRI
jgi:hypothetical protein